MVRLISTLAAAVALAACSSAITQADCSQAQQVEAWTVTFSQSSGPSTCPKIDSKTLSLPSCEVNCSCYDSNVVFQPAPNTATADTCSIRFYELCPSGYMLDCRYVNVDSPSHASGSCSYTATGSSDSCGYSVDWSAAKATSQLD